MNRLELDNIVQKVREEGRAVAIRSRDLVNAYGCERRTSGNVERIDAYLAHQGVFVYPTYKYPSGIENRIFILPKYEPCLMNFRINFLYIEEYKNLHQVAFKNLDSIERYLCLIGLNGSGKSNVLEAICAIFSHLYFIVTAPGTVKARLPFSYEINYSLNGNCLHVADGKLLSEGTLKRDALPRNIIASYSGEETRLYDGIFAKVFDDWRVHPNGYDSPFLWYISKDVWAISTLCLLASSDVDVQRFVNSTLEPIFEVEFIIDEVALGVLPVDEISNFCHAVIDNGYRFDSAGLTALLAGLRLSNRALFSLLYQATHKINRDKEPITGINITFAHKGNLTDLSEGEKKMIVFQTMVHVLADERSMCVLDEPDAHIHIGRKEDLVSLLSTERRYSVLTTHSPMMTDKMQKNNLIWLNHGTVGDLNWLQEVSELSGNQLNYIDGSFVFSLKKVLVVEGTTDKEILEHAITKFLPSHPGYKKFKDNVYIFAINSASEAVRSYENIFKNQIAYLDRLVYLFDYDQAGCKAKMDLDALGVVDGIKVSSMYYQYDYAGGAYPDNEKVNGASICLLEDMFAESAYSSVIASHFSHTCLREFRRANAQMAKPSETIKTYIREHYKSTEAIDLAGFERVLDNLLFVFGL